MESKLSKGYEPQSVEEKWYAAWEQDQLFHADETSDKAPYAIVIPPPNVTGVLHMGHALNNTLQDILCRWHRKPDARHSGAGRNIATTGSHHGGQPGKR